jgi:magnesium transporter
MLYSKEFKMIITYSSNSKSEIKREKVKKPDSIPSDAVWIDVMNPTEAEKKLLHDSFGVNIQSRNALDKTEVSNPFYNEDSAYYMTVTTIYYSKEGYLDGTPLTFILKDNRIITLRYTEPLFFTNCEAALRRKPELCQGPEYILGEIIHSLVNTIADLLETTGNNLDQLLNSVFENPYKYNFKNKRHSADYYEKTIQTIGNVGNVISKNRESLLSINRLLIFYNQIDHAQGMTKREHRQQFDHLASEVHSLGGYAAFISQRHMFLLDATLGLLGVEQNKIIKVFTVAAAVFMPPTMIASIYGMNFDNMPELHWEYSYPIALGLIVLSAILPYIYFKIKNLL